MIEQSNRKSRLPRMRVISRALSIVKTFVEASRVWPEDQWFGLSNHWDLNLTYTDPQPDGIQYLLAVIYPVENGKTDTLHESYVIARIPGSRVDE